LHTSTSMISQLLASGKRDTLYTYVTSPKLQTPTRMTHQQNYISLHVWHISKITHPYTDAISGFSLSKITYPYTDDITGFNLSKSTYPYKYDISGLSLSKITYPYTYHISGFSLSKIAYPYLYAISGLTSVNVHTATRMIP